MKENQTNKAPIFVYIFFLFALVTMGAIFYTNSKNTEKDNNDKNDQTKTQDTRKDVSGIDIHSTYDENSLKMEEMIEEINIQPENYIIPIKYLKIDGLKNEKIENQINKTIKDRTLGMITEEVINNIRRSDVEEIETSYFVFANYSNVLSVKINLNFQENGNFKNDEQYLNFDLVTGKELKLEDLFTKNTYVNEIVSKAIYYDLFLRSEYEQTLDKSKIEDETLKLMQKYNKNGLKFYFDERVIFLKIGEELIWMSMANDHENVAIYTRFIESNSIFTDENSNEKNIKVLKYSKKTSQNDEYVYDRKDDFIDDQTYVDSVVYSIGNQNEEVSNFLINEMQNIIIEHKKALKPDEIIVVNVNAGAYFIDGKYTVSLYAMIYKMQRSYFDTFRLMVLKGLDMYELNEYYNIKENGNFSSFDVGKGYDLTAEGKQIKEV